MKSKKWQTDQVRRIVTRAIIASHTGTTRTRAAELASKDIMNLLNPEDFVLGHSRGRRSVQIDAG